MKIKKIIVLSGLVLSFVVLTSFKMVFNPSASLENEILQKGFIIYATYDGHESYGYNFVTKGKDNEEYTLTFQKVDANVLKTFDLNSDALLKTKFKITFDKDIKMTKDADGYEDENEENTITALEKV
ncbi:hypothetical protein ACFFU9_11915 [Mariniflexile ostreae]|uniref:YxeA family protein n=1 Tax=Mariniflexile ostreae TaxID=1520892 RepID=A0ABV5FDA6_9FLAO